MSGDAIAPFSDTQTIFRKLKALPENKICFDCPIKNPTWCTIPYGAFVCLGTVLTISYLSVTSCPGVKINIMPIYCSVMLGYVQLIFLTMRKLEILLAYLPEISYFLI